jgi:uncharacterized repeat protein (TIGR01451 family)
MKSKWFSLIILTLLVINVFASPAQVVSAATSVITFESSSNPVDPYRQVTFTISAPLGGDPLNPLYGYVAFYDGGVGISGCSLVRLNFTNSGGPAYLPAECTTYFATPGTHEITAYFTSYNPSVYPTGTLTLPGGQTVNEFHPLTFTPETLTDGTYGTGVTQIITAECSEGVTCDGNVSWSTTGDLPAGTSFMPNYGTYTGTITGAPHTPGAYTFTVEANDSAGSKGSHEYTWTILQAIPEITEKYMNIAGSSLDLEVYVTHPNKVWSTQPSGSVSFSIDGTNIAACSGDNARPASTGNVAYCLTASPTGLGPGNHTVQVDFAPDEASSTNYTSVSQTFTLTVPATVSGLLFNDLDEDGVKDTGEVPVSGTSLQVALDQGCDGSIEKTAYSDYHTGQFSFYEVTPGLEYCLGPTDPGNWRPSVTLSSFTVDGNKYFEIGATYLVLSPNPLPTATLGQPYSQVISINGGTEPYSVLESSNDEELPDGMIFDSATLTLSGTPTALGVGDLYLAVQDAEGMTGVWDPEILVLAEGSFDLTSDHNPSTSGQEVTFTFSGSGEVVVPEINTTDPTPPIGFVAFYDGETLITGCEEVPLNFDPDTGFTALPAECITSALADGSHEITAEFTHHPMIDVYKDASRTLTQVVGEVTYVANFEFTSSPDPVDPYQDVTFTLSATGTYPDSPPFGEVDFFDDGIAISECSNIALNYIDNLPAAGNSAVCNTQFTTPGTHLITAEFTSNADFIYADETLTLEGGQTVNAYHPLTISPETLPNTIYGAPYSEHLTAACSEGVTCSTVVWGLEGDQPTGLELLPLGLKDEIGLFGAPNETGTFTFTMTADDQAGSYGEREYTVEVAKATPAVTESYSNLSVEDGIYFNMGFSHPTNPSFNPQPTGTVSYYINDEPVAACSGENAIPYNGSGYASCETEAPADLGPGNYTVKGVYTPDAASSDNYNSTYGTLDFTINTRVDGLLFEDLDEDGVRDTNEGPVPQYLTIRLDQDCDTIYEYNAHNDLDTGEFSIDAVAPGETYCLSVKDYYNWRQTTTIDSFVADSNKYFEIGVHNTIISFTPETLPNTSVGEYYSQEIVINGGTGPYTIIDEKEYLPEGMSFNQDTLTLSGTPTAVGYGSLSLEMQDANGMTGAWSSMFFVQTEGNFELTSVPNPSDSGGEVTFTFTGSGDVVLPGLGTVLPFGVVDFYDGETLITDCEDVLLNFDWQTYFVDQPAVCTTSALSAGSHEIKAEFRSLSEFPLFHDASLTITQLVGGSDNTPPAVIVTGVTDGSSYYFGSVPEAGCSTTDDGLGVAAEASLTLSGGDELGLGGFTATCSGAVDNAGNAADPVSVQYTVLPAADLSITTDEGKDAVRSGAKLTYTLTVSNAGPNSAQSLSLVYILDKDMSFDSVNIPSDWTCEYDKGKVTCTSDSLATGSAAIIKITVVVAKTATAGKDLVSNVNVSSATYDPVLTDNAFLLKTLVEEKTGGKKK